MYANQRVMGRILIKDAPLSVNQKEHLPFCSAQIIQRRAQLLPRAGPCWEDTGSPAGRAAASRAGRLSVSSFSHNGRATRPGPGVPAQPGCATSAAGHRSQRSLCQPGCSRQQRNGTNLLPFRSHLHSRCFPEEQISIKKRNLNGHKP